MMNEINKKRKSEREKFTEKILLEKGTDFSDLKYEALCTDISEYGIGLTTQCELKKTQIIKLFISLEKSKTKLPVFAEVVWTKEVDDRIKAGLRFLI